MLKKVTLSDMKEFITKQNPTFDKEYVEKYAKELINLIDERLDNVVYTYCKNNIKTDFSFTQNHETFSIFEIMAMRGCSFYEAVLLMNGFIMDGKTGRMRIMRR